jgi:hypothetical protein
LKRYLTLETKTKKDLHIKEIFEKNKIKYKDENQKLASLNGQIGYLSLGKLLS